MASKRLLDKRREHEAAEKQGKIKGKATAAAGKKTVRKPTTRKRKVKAPERKRLMWGVFSGTLKEEGRFAWNQKDLAEEKLEQLRAKSKKLYFIQPIKESISDSTRPPEVVIPDEDEEIVDDIALDDEDAADDGDEDADDDEEE